MEITVKLTEKQAELAKQYARVYDLEREWEIRKEYARIHGDDAKLPEKELESYKADFPIIAVEERDFIVLNTEYDSPYYGDDVIYHAPYNPNDPSLNESDGYTEADLRWRLKDKGYTDSEIEELMLKDEVDGLKKFYIKYFWEPIAFFLTRAEAENFCKQQKPQEDYRVMTCFNYYIFDEGDVKASSSIFKAIGEQLLQEEK